MEDREIKKALEYCSNQGFMSECEKCNMPNGTCRNVLVKYALDLINRLQAENEQLKANFVVAKQMNIKNIDIAHIKAEAYKEFAEKLHEELRMYGTKDKFNKLVFLNEVDKAKKEMVGKTNDE